MIELHEISRQAAQHDNCAIAIKTLSSGTTVRAHSSPFPLSHTILEGHRFATRLIPHGTALLSWGMAFGRALRDIHPGEYICNERVLHELRSRSLPFDLPTAPNFADEVEAFHFDASHFQPAPPLPLVPTDHTFMGYQRTGDRGVGTRNMIVLLGVNALVSGFITRLAQELQPLAEQFTQVDGIVAVTHTEGSQAGSNNEEMLLRTLAGFIVHPNVGAVLVMDAGGIGVTNRQLIDYAQLHGYSIDSVRHHFLSLQDTFANDLARAKAVVQAWLPLVDDSKRSPQPLSALKIALQCGGSDAFSGISGNPLAAWVSKQVVQAGGAAVLAETDELIGAEAYVLAKVRDAATARRFLDTVARFQEQAGWHGHSAHGNPSGGNLYRGLYNIYLKSLGAATKRHPDVRLDDVLAYSERMRDPGFYFMDSPGNDLESIAGQVAAGCNLIYFVTGNGSITNFPFVPTLKIVTTSDRYALLPAEMDVNAGAYLDGTPLGDLGETTLRRTLEVASGQMSVGEQAGHAQVQLWRNWQLSAEPASVPDTGQPVPDGRPLPLTAPQMSFALTYPGWRTGTHVASNRVGLILPASLCSGQIAQMAARRLTSLGIGKENGITQFVALSHTEGCGSSTQAEFVDTMLGYLTHPLVATSLILEHGCEKTHNDFWRQRLLTMGVSWNQIGWASVQGDGGIAQVLARIEDWFIQDCARLSAATVGTADLSQLRLGLLSVGPVDEDTATTIATLCQHISIAGGTVIMPEGDPLTTNKRFTKRLPLAENQAPTLAYAQAAPLPGAHMMAMPTTQWTEQMTGLGAAGVELIIALGNGPYQIGHPFVPVLRAAAATAVPPAWQKELDVVLSGNPSQRLQQFGAAMTAVLSRQLVPHLNRNNLVDFQITRGQLGVSL